MRMEYDKVADVMYFRIDSGKVANSIEIAEGIIVDYNKSGEAIGIEILAYSQRNLDLNQLIHLDSEELVAEVSGT
ncbi:MAG: DUF2283 domain-containing protein [Candidatus Thorarchaeota archaeon]|nr:DUF2283 domain-containing protein [Candidatus Thorarchaeota archaeon]